MLIAQNGVAALPNLPPGVQEHIGGILMMARFLPDRSYPEYGYRMVRVAPSGVPGVAVWTDDVTGQPFETAAVDIATGIRLSSAEVNARYAQVPHPTDAANPNQWSPVDPPFAPTTPEPPRTTQTGAVEPVTPTSPVVPAGTPAAPTPAPVSAPTPTMHWILLGVAGLVAFAVMRGKGAL
jgi:hypothetical protein